MPRIWWCPTGPLALLPVHAAGVYSGDEVTSIADFAVSSYIPTLDALVSRVEAQRKASAPGRRRHVVVYQPTTSGESSLPETIREVKCIWRRFQNLPGDPPQLIQKPKTIEEIFASPNPISVLHLACHGEQHAEEPLESAFILDAGPLTISRIMRERIPSDALAFLSACQTAKGDASRPDEHIHLAASMLFAGFQGVVGTMW